MPLYPFKCLQCGHEEDFTLPVEDRDRIEIPCLNCNISMKRQIAFSQNIEIFKEDVWEHIGHDPMIIRSKKQLKEECKKNGCFAPGYM